MRTADSTRVRTASRNGAVAPFVALLMVPLLSMVAFMVDYGYLTVVESDLQRAADAACLGGVMDLIPNSNGAQNFSLARNTARRYANLNLGYEPQLNPDDNSVSYGFTVLDSDIVTGKYDPSTINGTGPVSLNTSTSVIHNTMQVTVRRDATANSPVTLFFARVMGIQSLELNATAMAALRRPSQVRAGTGVLPFALPLEYWNTIAPGDSLTIFADNTIEDGSNTEILVTDPDTGTQVPGNWGTVDIGYDNNSTHDLSGQIIEGLRQADVDELYVDGRIADNIAVPLPVRLMADPGLSQGMKDSIISVYGQTRIIPIYDNLTSGKLQDAIGGANVEFNVVRWGVLKVYQGQFRGNKNTFIAATKTYTYDGALIPNEDLSDTSDTRFDDIFASPVLVR